MLRPIVVLTEMAQSRQESLGWKVLMKLHQLMGSSLDTTKNLRHYDSETEYYAQSMLDTFVQTIRSRLADSVRSRVFKR